MKYILLSTVMPPSVNQSLAVVRGRFIKTAKARLFESRAKRQIELDTNFHQYIKTLKDWVKESALRVDCYFIFPTDQIYTKTSKAKSRFKSLDVHNRIKQLHDAIVKATEVDDLYYFEGDTVKATSENCTEPYVLIKIKPIKPRTLHDILRTLDNET